MQRTLVLIKPDGVKRGIVGDIIHRFEKSGLKIVGMKMVRVDRALVDKHYPDSRTELLQGIGEKTLQSYKEHGKNVKKELGTEEPMEIGKIVNNWNKDFLSSGPIVAIVLEGHHAIPNVRRIVGHTFPSMANPGTIRGDYSLDNPVLANERKRPVINIIHASGNEEEAKYEIDLWFASTELHTYTRAEESVMF
jgi:nucleoside-diphosphate kinase